jgi:hypothetical protein
LKYDYRAEDRQIAIVNGDGSVTRLELDRKIDHELPYNLFVGDEKQGISTRIEAVFFGSGKLRANVKIIPKEIAKTEQGRLSYPILSSSFLFLLLSLSFPFLLLFVGSGRYSISGSLDLDKGNNDAAEALENYRKRAKQIITLDQKPNGLNILRDIDAKVDELLKEMKDESSMAPFIFIDNSSGMGKTQMAFNLMERSENDNSQRPVHYLLCTVPNKASQAIYLSFQQRSQLFLKCCHADLESIKVFDKQHSELQPDMLSKLSLYTFGFIQCLLRGFVSIPHFKICTFTYD